MGEEKKQNLCLRGLQNSAGYLQQKVGKRIDTRYTPRIEFVLDKGIQHSLIVTKILDEVLPSERDDAAESAETPVTEQDGSEAQVQIFAGTAKRFYRL